MIRIRFLLGHGITALLFSGLLYPAIAFADLQGWSAAVARKDYTAANRELRSVAEQGNARAQFELGIVYQYGLGVDVNFAEAADWFQKAANKNYVLAQLNLGTMYVEGQGVPQDYKKDEYC
jgi:uncharacterized protein